MWIFRCLHHRTKARWLHFRLRQEKACCRARARVRGCSRKAMKGFIEKSYSMGQLHGEMKKINDPRRQNLIETVHLTKAEENKIDTLFISTYGKKIKYDWHRLYQSFTGKFDENYFPEYLFSSQNCFLSLVCLSMLCYNYSRKGRFCQ